MATRRTTRQQQCIRTTLEDAGRPLSVDELHRAAVEAVPTLSRRTVYRVIRRLEADGELCAVAVLGEAPRYEPTHVARTHHHHFHCSGCGRVFDVEGCPGQLGRLVPEGFTLDDHEVTLRGRCDQCA